MILLSQIIFALVFHRQHSQQVQHLLLRVHLLRIPQPGSRSRLPLHDPPVPQSQIPQLRLWRLALLPGNKLNTGVPASTGTLPPYMIHTSTDSLFMLIHLSVLSDKWVELCIGSGDSTIRTIPLPAWPSWFTIRNDLGIGIGSMESGTPVYNNCSNVTSFLCLKSQLVKIKQNSEYFPMFIFTSFRYLPRSNGWQWGRIPCATPSPGSRPATTIDMGQVELKKTLMPFASLLSTSSMTRQVFSSFRVLYRGRP